MDTHGTWMRAQHLALYDSAARWWIPLARLTIDGIATQQLG